MSHLQRTCLHFRRSTRCPARPPGQRCVWGCFHPALCLSLHLTCIHFTTSYSGTLTVMLSRNWRQAPCSFEGLHSLTLQPQPWFTKNLQQHHSTTSHERGVCRQGRGEGEGADAFCGVGMAAAPASTLHLASKCTGEKEQLVEIKAVPSWSSTCQGAMRELEREEKSRALHNLLQQLN